MAGRSSCWWWSFATCIGAIVFILLFNLTVWVLKGRELENILHPTRLSHQCTWSPNSDPVIFHLRTKLGVNYDGGHWFHMAENFMVQHSILRSSNSFSNASKVLYNFDQERFVDHLNGITRLMVYLGTQEPHSNAEELYYVHLKSPIWMNGLAVGSTISLRKDDIDEVQVIDLRDNGIYSSPTSAGGQVHTRRFSPVQHLSSSHNSPVTSPTGENVKLVASNRTLYHMVDVHALPTVSATSPTVEHGVLNEYDTRLISSRRNLRHNQNIQHVMSSYSNYSSVSNSFKSLGQFPPPTVIGNKSNSVQRALQQKAGKEKHNYIQGTNRFGCVKYVGTIGGDWPTVQRGHWFPNKGDIEAFRHKLRDACPPLFPLLTQSAKNKKYKLVIYQRDLSRKLANEEDAVAAISAALPDAPDWEVLVLMHSTSRSPCELAHLLNNVDVLVTPHGFQSMLLLFLPRPSLLFEIFPYRYYKRGYGPFGHEYGIKHSGVMSPAMTWHTEIVLSVVPTMACMDSKYCRNYARNQDVKLTSHGVNALAAFVKENLPLLGRDKVQSSIPTDTMHSLQTPSSDASGTIQFQESLY